MPLKQENRLLAIGAIGTKLDADVLTVKSISVEEQLSRPFQIEAELRSESGTIKFDDVIGQNITLRLDLDDDTRYFNGYISRLVQLPNVGRYAHYRATIVPWLWFLTRLSDCRIFLDKTVPEILQEVFTDHGYDDFKDKLSNDPPYQKKEFCVQYRETDFNFVSRLMEQEGIYYYFEHTDGKHTLVLADSLSAHSPTKGYEEIAFQELQKGPSDAITEWIMEKELQTVAYKMRSFDFKKPKLPLLSAASVSRDYGFAQSEMFDYPGGYIEQGEGDRLSQTRLDELQSQYELLRGQTSAQGIATGSLFTMKNHPDKSQNREYLITGTSLRVQSGEYASDGEPDEGDFFTCNFTAIPSKQPYRAPRITPKPVIQGPQTAIVVGKKGEEIDTDEFGRVKLQFHWDRYGQLDENSSCWIRVSQGWAGKSWGAINIPRIGQEVIVEFLEGDPDQPIITGRVYNGLATTPYKLPDNKTRSTLKSNSSKGGNGFNEIRFEDKKGCEQIFIHAEKDEDVRVKADARESVGGGRHLTVGGDQKEKVDGEKHLTVKGDQFGKIEGDQCQMVTGHQFFSVDLDHFLTVKGVMSLQVKEDVNVKGKNLKSQAETKISMTAGGDIHEKAGNNYALAATNEVHIKGKTVVIEADSQLSLKVGGSFIDIGSSAVAIKGGQVTMNCGGSPASGSGSSPDAPDAPVLPDAPKEPAAAADDKPGAVDEVPEPPKPPDPAQYSDAAQVLQAAAVDGKPLCEQCDKEMEEEADKGDLDEEIKEDDDELLGEDSPEEDESPASS
jgi:type VI secretion system secreted protein VgrG